MNHDNDIKGRFAPSPSGRMHLGNLFTALMSWLSVKSRGGKWLLRIEDLDPQRSRREFSRLIEDDLHWLGIDWDEGGLADTGPTPPYSQSQRSHRYADAMQKLLDSGKTFPCYCTRAEIMATQIGSALGFSGGASNRNILPYNSKTETKGYMQGIMNQLGTSLSNVRGAYAEGITSYPVEKSVYILRYKAFNKLMTIDNGAIVNSDIGQKILLNGKFDDSGTRYLGGAVMGMYRGILIKVVPDEYFDMAAGLLNLTKEEKAQFDKIDGYICNGIGTYFGRASVVRA